MTRVLLVYESKHGSTTDVAHSIADGLRGKHIEVDIYDQPSTAPAPQGYDAVILGSAVYFGRWQKDIRAYYEQHRASLAKNPNIWLFSSGPVGKDDQLSSELPLPVEKMIKSLPVKSHAIFYGRLDHDNLNFFEMAMTKAAGAPAGDFRQWDTVGTWAERIATTLL